MTLPEAPASVNFRTTYKGMDMQFTLRDENEANLLKRLGTFVNSLVDTDMSMPVENAAQPAGAEETVKIGKLRIECKSIDDDKYTAEFYPFLGATDKIGRYPEVKVYGNKARVWDAVSPVLHGVKVSGLPFEHEGNWVVSFKYGKVNPNSDQGNRYKDFVSIREA